MKNAAKILTSAVAVTAVAATALKQTNDFLTKRSSSLYQKMAEKMAVITDEDMLALRDKYTSWFDNYGYEEHEIISDNGEKLKGYLFKAKEETDKYIFGAHGYRCNARVEFCLFACNYIEMGLNVFVVDHRGAGQSEGEYIGLGYYESQDSMKWLDYMVENFGEDIQIGLHGVSMGCATVLKMSGDEKLPKNVKFVVADCGYTDASGVFEYKMGMLGSLAKPIIKGLDLFNKKTAGYSYKDTDVTKAVAKMNIPVLFVHGSEDELIPYGMSVRNYNICPMASMDKELFIVKGSGHACNIVIDGEGYMQRVASFIERYMA